MLLDLKYALRTLLKSPGFSFVAVLALALGIGAASATFSAVNALLLKPMPLMKDQSALLNLTEYFDNMPGHDAGIAYPDYLDWKKRVTTMDVAVAEEATIVLTGGERPDRYLGAMVSANTFSLLGVDPILGRQFRPEEDSPQAEPVALLGYEVWQHRFRGDPAVVGTKVTLNGALTTIIGVMPKGWRFPEVSDVWMPLRLDEKEHRRGNFFLLGTGRLKPGVTLAQARSELAAVAATAAREHPDFNSGLGIRAAPLRERTDKQYRTLMLLIMGAVMLVHLIACGNVANLLLARGAARAKELAIRAALGATRGRIIRQLLLESLLIGLLGALGGSLVSVWGVDLMLGAIPVEIPYWFRFEFDWSVFGFALLAGLLSSALFGIFPAWQTSRPNLVEALKESGRSSHSGPHGQRVRSTLIIAEVALALVLLMGAGLMLRSFLKLQQADIGADATNTLTFRAGLPPSQYPKAEVAARFFTALMPKLAAIPGVESAAAVSSLPTTSQLEMAALMIEGEPEPTRLHDARVARTCSVTPGYFETMRIALRSGRGFAHEDGEDALLVTVIDEQAAAEFFPNRDPLGRRLRLMDGPEGKAKWATVIGVARNVAYDRLTSGRAFPFIYFAQEQMPSSFLSVVLRTKSDPATYADAARAAVVAVNKDIPIYRVFTMEEIVAQSYWERKYFGSLFVLFAVVALFLASLGIHGVMTYSVRQRTQEIGLRMALGAQAGDVLQLITSHGMQLIGTGLVVGLIGSYFLTRLLAGNLHGISTHDPVSFAVVPLLLFVVGLAACYLPARWATRVDPMEALRYQ